jgi:hypothetical protein
MMSCDISDLMKRALGLDFPKGTLQKWRSNYLSTFKNAENYQVLALRIRTFLKGNSKEQYTGPSREVVEALFVCGKCRKESEASCVQRLKEAFPEYADRFTLEHAQVRIYLDFYNVFTFRKSMHEAKRSRLNTSVKLQQKRN